MCLCACACVTAAGSVGKRTGTIITRKKKQQQQRLTWPEFFRLTINKQNVSRFAVEAPGVGSLGLWRNSSHSYGKSEKKKKKSRIAFKGGRDQILPSGWRREASGGIDETWGKTKNKYRQRRTRVWFARLCQTHTSLLLSPSLSLNSWLFCCCCFSRSAKLLFTGKWNKKMTRVWKIKLKKMWKCLFALTGVGRRRTSARNIHRWTQEGNKLDATERSRIIRKEISGRWVHLSVHWRFWIESTFWYKTTKTTRSSIWLRGHSKKCGAQKDWCIRNRAHDGIIVHLKKWRNFFFCCKFQFFDTICFCFS